MKKKVVNLMNKEVSEVLRGVAVLDWFKDTIFVFGKE